MRLRKGCGCPILILGLMDLLFFVSGIIAYATKKSTIWGSLLIILVGLGNAIVCAIVGLAAIRGETLSGRDTSAPEGEDIEGEEESETAPPSSGEEQE